MKMRISCAIGSILILTVLTVSSIALADEYEERPGEGIIIGDSGLSTGGHGVVTCEPFANVEKIARYKQNMMKDSVNYYPITDQDFGIYYVSFVGGEDENDVAMRAEFLNSSSKCINVSQDIPGTIYKNINVWIGSPIIKDAIIRFKIENAWLKTNDISVQNFSAFQWNKNDNKWKILETKIIHMDDTYTYFESKANGLSQFALSGLTPEIASEIINNPEFKESPTIEVSPKTGFTNRVKIISGIFIFLIIGIIAAYFVVKRKK